MDYFHHELLRLAELLLVLVLLLGRWISLYTGWGPFLAIFDFVMSSPEVKNVCKDFWETLLQQYCPPILNCINHISSPEVKAFVYVIASFLLLVLILQSLKYVRSKCSRDSLKSIMHDPRGRIHRLLTRVKCIVCPVHCCGPERCELARRHSFRDDRARGYMSDLPASTLAENGFYYEDNTVVCWRCRGHLRGRSECANPLRDSHSENCIHHPNNSREGNYRHSFGCEQNPSNRITSSVSTPNVREMTERPAAESSDQHTTETTVTSFTSAPQPAADDDNQAVGGTLDVTDEDDNIHSTPTRPQQQ